MFVGLTRSDSGLFGAAGFIVSPVGKRESRGKRRRRVGGEKGIEEEWKDEEGIKKD